MSRQQVEKFISGLGSDVSRETLPRLDRYAALLEQWQRSINLVGPATLPDLWTRHFLDSLQIIPHLPCPAGRIADFGSGAGFPGLVLAAAGFEDIHLVESDKRKGIFLSHVSREIGAPVVVHHKRIEALDSLRADTITARALAPLTELLAFSYRHLKPDGEAVFLKGSGWAQEAEHAAENWQFHMKHFPSLTNPEGAIVRLGSIRPRTSI